MSADARPDDAPPVDPDVDASARVVVARVLGSTGARSVAVVGQDTAPWADACRDLGVPEVVRIGSAPDDGRVDEGVAGEGADHGGHLVRDLAQPLDVGQQFGLAICVDVAHHLPPERAAGLVADLTGLAPVVLFSAAVPGQGRAQAGGTGDGDDHVHERWPEHWAGLFEAEGWTCRDAVRPWIRTNDEVAWWYRQGLFLAVAASVERAYTSFPLLTGERPVQPVDYLVRPAGEAMSPPAEPRGATDQGEVDPGDDGEPDALTGAADGDEPLPLPPPSPPTNGTAPAPLGPSEEAADAGSTGGVDEGGEPGPGEPGNADANGTDEALTFPEPPGWATLRRVAERARRRARG